ncbi:MAG: hypothetical protein WC441_03690 [Patescibacteria group bacterium]
MKEIKNKKYNIKPVTLIIHDEASVRFHVKNDDYFGTIATVLSLIKQDCKKSARMNQSQTLKILGRLEKDLLFLQKNYQIKAKTSQKKIIPKGRLQSQ